MKYNLETKSHYPNYNKKRAYDRHSFGTEYHKYLKTQEKSSKNPHQPSPTSVITLITCHPATLLLR